MMISETMVARLNEQVTNEFNASHSYLAMACQFESWSLVNLAKRFREQADEEREHALKLVDYTLEAGGTVKPTALAEPRCDYKSAEEIIATALEQEQTVTAQINALVDLAQKENDHATRHYLQWFVDEQVEEVSSMSYLLDVARMAGDNLLQLDNFVRHLMKPE